MVDISNDPVQQTELYRVLTRDGTTVICLRPIVFSYQVLVVVGEESSTLW